MKLDIIRFGRRLEDYDAVIASHNGRIMRRFDNGHPVSDWREAVDWFREQGILDYSVGREVEAFMDDTGINLFQDPDLIDEPGLRTIPPYPEIDTPARRFKNYPRWFYAIWRFMMKHCWEKMIQYRCNICGVDRSNQNIGIAKHIFSAAYENNPGRCEVVVKVRFCRDEVACKWQADEGRHRRIIAIRDLFRTRYGIAYKHTVDSDKCTFFIGFPDLVKGTFRDPNLKVKSIKDLKYVSD